LNYYLDIEHKGLAKFKRIRGNDQFVIRRRAEEQLRMWDSQWQRKQELDEARRLRLRVGSDRIQKKSLAQEQTEDAQFAIDELRNILSRTLNSDAMTWDSLYDRSELTEPRPETPTYEDFPKEPKADDAKFRPRIPLWGYVIPFFKRIRIGRATRRWKAEHDKWAAEVELISERNNQHFTNYKQSLRAWNDKLVAFKSAQNETNSRIEILQQRHLNKESDAIVEFTDLILSRSDYPNCFPKHWEIAFDGPTGVMVVDYDLPDLDSLPKVAAVKYIQARDEFESVLLKDKESEALFETAIYQTCLRTVREICTSDHNGAIRSVTFNGYVNFIDRSNGKPARSCIVSLQATKATIDTIDFNAVDPKACFRALKGVGSAKLAGMVAIVPILKMNRMDERFVPARDVIDGIDPEINIAAIPWEEFEHLVRDVFEKEFASSGGEVKITRASRDHGVDAVAFDPDPIRGGKIVIQAKRYTNTVGVSAVRDLYGTLINEGASRGILVTTSVYGPDSYEFANGKPITLLNGGNLLHLLAKHGHPARIDLQEAKKILLEKS